jgi:hypothetical protein
MNRNRFCIFIALYALLSGCTSLTTPGETIYSSTTTSSATSSQSQESTPQEIIPASTTSTPRQNSIPSITTPISWEISVNIERTVPEGINWAGTLVGFDRNQDQFVLLRFPQFVAYPLPGNRPSLGINSLFAISPDRSKLAYIDTTSDGNKKLRIVTGDNTEQIVATWSGENGWIVIEWLDNERISLAEINHRDGTVFVYNSSSGEIAELIPFFPAVTSRGKLLPSDIFPAPFVYYDLSLTRLVVVRYIEEESSKRNYDLWDVRSQTSLWNNTGFFGSDERPVWSPDGSNFSISLAPHESEDQGQDNCAELFLVNHTGEQELLDKCIWGSSSWSPDGVYLATWKTTKDDACRHGEYLTGLLITNIKTGDRDTYTICSGDTDNPISMRQYPIWSPDGNYIAFNLYDIDLIAVEVVILDLAYERAYLLPEINEVLGWMYSGQ